MPPLSPTARSRSPGSHNRQWIGGRHVVLETLRAGRWIPLELASAGTASSPEAREVLELARTLGIRHLETTADQLGKLCRSDEHQGFAIRMPEFPYSQLDDLLPGPSRAAALLLLDRVQDSHNFGAILRSAEVFGFDGVVVGTREQSPVNGQVLRSSAGAINHVSLARTEDLPDAVEQLKQSGVRLVGTSPDAPVVVSRADLRLPTVLAVGNEGRGLSEQLLALCDECVRIPQQGQTGSLNAAVSAGVLCYELRRQRGG